MTTSFATIVFPLDYRMRLTGYDTNIYNSNYEHINEL